MPNKLKNVEISQIDFVDYGASVDKASGEGAHIILAKRIGKSMYEEPATTFAEEMATEQQRELADSIHCEIMEMVWPLITAITKTVFDKAADREAMIAESMQQFSTAMLAAMPAWLSGEVEKGQLSAEIAEQLGRVIKSISGQQAGKVENTMPEETKKTAPAAAPDAKPAEPPAAQPADTGDVAKRMADLEKANAAMAEEIKKSNERTAAAELLAKQERDTRILRDVQDDLAKNFSAMPTMSAEKDAPLFKKIQEGEALAKEDVARLREILTAANEAIKSGKLFSEAGTSGGGDSTSAMAKAKAKAGELVKSGAYKTEAAALAAVFEQNAELYNQYEAERKAATRVQ